MTLKMEKHEAVAFCLVFQLIVIQHDETRKMSQRLCGLVKNWAFYDKLKFSRSRPLLFNGKMPKIHFV